MIGENWATHVLPLQWGYESVCPPLGKGSFLTETLFS